jgi:hypothetical protein
VQITTLAEGSMCLDRNTCTTKSSPKRRPLSGEV